MTLTVYTHNPETGGPTGAYGLEKVEARYRPMGGKYADVGRGLELHRTDKGKWALFRWSEWEGDRDYATWLTDAEARDWLTDGRDGQGGYTDDQADEIIARHTGGAA